MFVERVAGAAIISGMLMSDYDNLPPSKPVKRRAAPAVFGIGWCAFINCPRLPGGELSQTVPTLDALGAADSNSLHEGTEVQILAWLPKSRNGALYQVRRLRDGAEAWVLGIHLRHKKDREPAMAAGTAETPRT